MAGSFCKYHCNYCDEDINDIRVKCSECPDFDLCLQCFSCGAEIGSHRSRHSYQLIDCGTFPIFGGSDKWRALDELALLEAIEQYGFGNWADIADSIGRNITADEAKEHYSNYYILGSIGRAVWTQTDASELTMRDHTCPNDGPLSPSLTTPLPAITDVSQKDEDLLGYMPKRDDFEREYDNECETLVSTLSMNSTEDDEIEISLKLAHVSMYRMRLKERFRKKQIAREYGLVSQFFKSHNAFKDTNHTTPQKNSNNVNKKNSKQTSSQDNESQFKSSFDDKYKPFLRFQTFEESRELFQNIQREKEIKSKIKELVRYRKNGLKRMNETIAFEAARSERQKRKENKKKSIQSASIGSAHKRLLGTATKTTAAEQTKDQNSIVSQTTRKSAKESPELAQKDDNKLKNEKDFDITSLPNCRLLSEKEKKLCTSVRLRPSQYITLKALILKDHNQKRKGSTSSHSSLENIDKSLRRKVFNFMVKSGWISS